MQLIEQFTERNIKQFKNQNLLVINPPSAAIANTFNQLKISNTIHFLHHFFHNFPHNCMHSFKNSYEPNETIKREKSEHTYGIDQDLTTSVKSPDAIVLYFCKEKKLSDLFIRVIAYQLAQLSDVTTLYLLGEKNSGVQSFVKKNVLFTSIEKLDAARHCNLFKTTINLDEVKQGPHKLEDFYTSYTIDDLIFYTLPGVFSQKKLDEGTQMLLPHLAELKTANESVLDYGCGCGVIALTLKKLNPSLHIDAIDTNYFAIQSTLFNAQQNQLPLNKVIASNGYSQISQRYDWIISNPPFHQHLVVDMQIAYQLITDAKQYLKPNGSLLIVVNTFLTYEDVLHQHFTSVSILDKTPKYTIYLATQAK